MSGQFAAVFVALFVAHQVADHWVQTQHQADTKGLPGWPGRIACAAHVTSYGASGLLALAALVAFTDLALSLPHLAAGMAVNLITHYIADRRSPLLRIASFLGSGTFYRLGIPRPGKDDNPCLGTGAYALDQSWHYGWLFVSAIIITQ